MSVFINLGDDGLSINGGRRQLIRSQAMKAYRRQQRDIDRRKHTQSGPNKIERQNESVHAKNIDDDACSSSAPTTQTAASHATELAGQDGNAPDSAPVEHQKTHKLSAAASSNSCGSLLGSSGAEHSSLTTQGSEVHLTQTMQRPLRSPAAYRQQLIVPFMDAHFSRDMPNLHLVHAKVNAWLRPSHGPSMIIASNAVLLHALAFTQGDDSLMWNARYKNNEAVKSLRLLLQKRDGLRNDEAVLTTDALALFDTSSEAWPNHARGLCALIAARTPDYWRTRANLLHDLVFQLLMHALLTREPFVLGEAAWLSAMSPTCRTRLHRLIFLGCHIPNILVRCDRRLNSCQSSNESSASLWQSIINLERSLQEWLSDWYRADFQSRPPYGLNTGMRSLRLGEQIAVELPPLRGSYTFPSLVEAIGHNCFWTLLLVVCEARYDLLSSHSSRAEIVVPRDAATLVESVARYSATQCADAICRTAPFIMQSFANIPGGLANSAGPLIVAARWYDKCGKPELASWCSKTADSLTGNSTQYPGWITRSCAAWITAAL